MLDELLGRAELKERIASLEDEKESLRRRYEAEHERRAEAVTARQEVEERANRLEDRIAELEGRVERLQGEAGGRDLEFRGVEDIRGDRLDEVCARLRSVRTAPEGALTAMLDGSDERPAAVAELLGDRAPLLRRASPCLLLVDDARLVSVALDLPMAPDPFVEWGETFRIEESWVRPTGRHAVALVRSDLFAYGTYDGRERLGVEGFESDVKGDHSKGGFSQARFERRRDEQIENHLERSRTVIERHDPETLIVLGERTVLDAFDDLADRTTTVDARGAPAAALDDAVHEFWTTRLYLL